MMKKSSIKHFTSFFRRVAFFLKYGDDIMMVHAAFFLNKRAKSRIFFTLNQFLTDKRTQKYHPLLYVIFGDLDSER